MIAKLPIKKVITEVLLLALILPSYIILFFVRRFWHVIKIITDVESILNKDEFLEDVEQYWKIECLKGTISNAKLYLLSAKK